MIFQMKIRSFTGGVFDTNCFIIEHDGRTILMDAPQDSADWLAGEKIHVNTLLLTHGHFDHVIDAARIKREHGCVVAYHRDGVRMLTEPGFFKSFGFGLEIEPIAADLLIDESESKTFEGLDFKVLLVPGHCPGSLCFFSPSSRILFGGDVLFAGSVGRSDFPGGDGPLLISGIVNKILPLGDDVAVLPGHGPSTTVGEERRNNPFLRISP
jgi:hydroxyacylglutathione hydrolase